MEKLKHSAAQKKINPAKKQQTEERKQEHKAETDV